MSVELIIAFVTILVSGLCAGLAYSSARQRQKHEADELEEMEWKA